MRSSFLTFLVLGLPILALAQESEDEEPRKKPVPPLEVLANLKADEMPPEPLHWVSPQGVMVLHGDLFGDGRHLAVDGSVLAVGGKKGWKVVSEWEGVLPAWVPADVKPEDAGYHFTPPERPFVLKDVSGDKVPEILIAFSNDRWRQGYRIVKKKGEGAELLKVRSEQGEPRFDAGSGFMVLCSADWGRKAWGSVDTFYCWAKGSPVEVGSYGNFCADSEHETVFVMRPLPNGTRQAFGIRLDEGKLVVQTGKFGAFEIEDAKDYATVRDAGDKENLISYGTTLLFERVTGIPGELRFGASPQEGAPEARERKLYKEAKAAMKLEIEGTVEAKALLGGKKPEPKKR